MLFNACLASIFVVFGNFRNLVIFNGDVSLASNLLVSVYRAHCILRHNDWPSYLTGRLARRAAKEFSPGLSCPCPEPNSILRDKQLRCHLQRAKTPNARSHHSRLLHQHHLGVPFKTMAEEDDKCSGSGLKTLAIVSCIICLQCTYLKCGEGVLLPLEAGYLKSWHPSPANNQDWECLPSMPRSHFSAGFRARRQGRTLPGTGPFLVLYSTRVDPTTSSSSSATFFSASGSSLTTFLGRPHDLFIAEESPLMK